MRERVTERKEERETERREWGGLGARPLPRGGGGGTTRKPRAGAFRAGTSRVGPRDTALNGGGLGYLTRRTRIPYSKDSDTLLGDSDTPLEGLGYPTRRTRIPDSEDSDTLLGGLGYPTRRARIPDEGPLRWPGPGGPLRASCRAGRGGLRPLRFILP